MYYIKHIYEMNGIQRVETPYKSRQLSAC